MAQAKYYVTLDEMRELIQLKRANKLTHTKLNDYRNIPHQKISVLFTRSNRNSCFFVYKAV